MKLDKIDISTSGSGVDQPAIWFAGVVGGNSSITNCCIRVYRRGIQFGGQAYNPTTWPTSADTVRIDNISFDNVLYGVWDKYVSGCRFFFSIDNCSFDGSFDPVNLIKTETSHAGIGYISVSSLNTGLKPTTFVDNPVGQIYVFQRGPGTINNGTYTPDGSELSQHWQLRFGQAGVIVNAGTIGGLAPGIGYGQTVRLLSKGITVSNANNVTTPINAAAQDVIDYVWDGTSWRPLTLGTWTL